MNNKEYIDHEVRIRLQEELTASLTNTFNKIDERFDAIEEKVDSQFKWMIGGALTLLFGMGMHLMGLM